MKNIVILTGAGISAESGIETFRGSDGLWENHKVTDVATPEAFRRDPELVLRFYNQRRKQIRQVQPNIAHKALVKLEKKYNVNIITQNIDDLHERSGSKNVLHLHGEINQSRSSIDASLIYNIIDVEMKMGELCELNSQLRPNIVWFGEEVPMMEKAIPLMLNADIVIVIGTSLQVYPAAGLLDFTSSSAKVFNIDPNCVMNSMDVNLTIIKQKASIGVTQLVHRLLD
ncbi:MAG: NAD-dependent deacylase [Alcanivoracaceae bacterium]|nr:NAD-dependent deacylase [Alcanivoracaceae bacterium]